ncbi:hypothetical protein THAOC_01206, partial [Thalassiosira oceanica]
LFRFVVLRAGRAPQLPDQVSWPILVSREGSGGVEQTAPSFFSTSSEEDRNRSADRSARSAYQVAHSKAPGLGCVVPRTARGGPQSVFSSKIRLWPTSESSIYRQNSDLRRTSIYRVVRPELDGVVRMGRKVASRNRLVELYKPLSIDEFGSPELAPKEKRWVRSDDSRRRLAEESITTINHEVSYEIAAPIGGGREAKMLSIHGVASTMGLRLGRHSTHCGGVSKTDAARPRGSGKKRKTRGVCTARA